MPSSDIFCQDAHRCTVGKAIPTRPAVSVARSEAKEVRVDSAVTSSGTESAKSTLRGLPSHLKEIKEIKEVETPRIPSQKFELPAEDEIPEEISEVPEESPFEEPKLDEFGAGL